jgi:hypothetical protein
MFGGVLGGGRTPYCGQQHAPTNALHSYSIVNILLAQRVNQTFLNKDHKINKIFLSIFGSIHNLIIANYFLSIFGTVKMKFIFLSIFGMS